ncbi:MAG: NAD-dependent epimerase/dehydratase family protein, partial [Deltaproteobacteria bacterium]|nr:NAD-dependent epimerase/dehydratase family protein [Deltaproteobacteria bacterium]
MKPVALVTGAAGFIGSYLVPELLSAGYRVIGVDDLSKYGPVKRPHDGHPDYELIIGDASDPALMNKLAVEADYLVAGAAMVGGIHYFHRFAWDLFAKNERISLAAVEAALASHAAGRLRRVVLLSSSMVYESASVFPTPESVLPLCPPPASAYGFQKLAAERL